MYYIYKQMENLYSVILYSLAGIISVVFADIRRHLFNFSKFSVRKWWVDNKERIVLILCIIFAIQFIVRVIPESAVLISASIGANIDVNNTMANYTLAVTVASMILVVVKKPTNTPDSIPHDNNNNDNRKTIDEEINELKSLALELGKDIDFNGFDPKNTEHCEL